MDIAKIHEELVNEEQAVVVTICDKLSEPYKAADGTDCTISVVGSDSTRFKEQEKANKKWAKHLGRMPTDEETNRLAVKQIATCCVAWHGFEKDGKPWEFSTDNVAKLLTDFDHILDQVTGAVFRHKRFFTSNSAASLPS